MWNWRDVPREGLPSPQLRLLVQQVILDTVMMTPPESRADLGAWFLQEASRLMGHTQGQVATTELLYRLADAQVQVEAAE
jgi:hypothetical protein